MHQHQSPALCWKDLKRCPHAIRVIEKPTEEMWLYAISQCGKLIEFHKNPSEKLMLAAINTQKSID